MFFRTGVINLTTAKLQAANTDGGAAGKIGTSISLIEASVCDVPVLSSTSDDQFADIESVDPALLHDSRQSFVCPNCRILKLPRLLTGWWSSLPLKLQGESSRKRSCDDAQGVLGELGILLGGFRESKTVQLRVDLNRLHATIIPSRVEGPYCRTLFRKLIAVVT